MITKEISISVITITEIGNIEVRVSTRILEDGMQLSETYHRHVVDPWTDLSNEAQQVKDIAAVVFTPELLVTRTVQQDGVV